MVVIVAEEEEAVVAWWYEDAEAIIWLIEMWARFCIRYPYRIAAHWFWITGGGGLKTMKWSRWWGLARVRGMSYGNMMRIFQKCCSGSSLYSLFAKIHEARGQE